MDTIGFAAVLAPALEDVDVLADVDVDVTDLEYLPTSTHLDTYLLKYLPCPPRLPCRIRRTVTRHLSLVTHRPAPASRHTLKRCSVAHSHNLLLNSTATA